MRLLVALNPAAGGGGEPEGFRDGLRSLEQKGHQITVAETGDAGQTRALVAERGPSFDRVVVCGGDGTVSAAVRGLLECGCERPPPLAIVPAGTGNDFARSVGAEIEPFHALSLAADGVVVWVDAGLAGSRPFVNAVSGGAPAEISRAVPGKAKATLGKLAYLAVGIARFASLRPFQATVRGEGFRHSGPVLFFAVANGRWVGGGSCVAPEARVDDGLLDLVVLPRDSTGLFGAARALRRGTDHPALIRARGEWFALEAERSIVFTCDGEPRSADREEFRILRGAVPVVVPAPAPAVAAEVQPPAP